MAISLTDRLTAAIRIAESGKEHAQRQVDYANWHEILLTLQDARDALGKPQSVFHEIAARQAAVTGDAATYTADFGTLPDPRSVTALGEKLDGRTKAARALKAQQGQERQ